VKGTIVQVQIIGHREKIGSTIETQDYIYTQISYSRTCQNLKMI